MENRAYLGLGTNVGDRLDNLKRAVFSLNMFPESKISAISSVYETLPYGNIIQDNFYNAVCEFMTDMTPPELLERVKYIESRLGRKERERWGPREIDIDILLYNDLIYSDDKMIIPHKELIKRDFAVIPLLEINPDIIHPELKIKLADVKFTVEEIRIVKKFDYNLKTVGD